MNFPLGRIVATRTLLDHMVSINVIALPYIERHRNREWGNLSRADKQANDDALEQGGRILSKYLLPDRTPIYVITEADRSVTTLMLCADY